MLRPAERQVRMVIGVVPNLVSFVDDATNKRRVTLCVYSNHEKGRLDVCCFENVQDLRRPSRIGAVIKGDRHLMLAASALMIERRKFCELFIFGCKIAVSVDSQLSHPIRAILVLSDNF